MKLRETFIYIALAMAAVVTVGLSISGCGSKGANVVTVAVACGPTTVLVTQTATCAANVSGSSNTKVTWSCTYTTTTGGTTSQASPCTDATGNVPANSSDATVVFTAPAKVPVPLPTITITAKSDADATKTGTATLSLDSGIRTGVSPTTATVPTKSTKKFTPNIIVPNSNVSPDVTWLVTQQASTSTTPLPEATSCAPGCGSIDSAGLYTAPDAIPSTPTVTVVVASKSDPSKFATATVTVVQGGPITFNGISPTVVVQGAFQQDVYLDAPNVSSISSIVIKRPDATIDKLGDDRFKTVFPVPNSTPASQTSIGARIRLTAADLRLAGTYQLCIDDKAWPVTPPGCANSVFPAFASLGANAVRPSITGTLPITVVEGDTSVALTVNGGYFGAPNSSLVTATFEATPSTTGSTNLSARQLSVTGQTVSVLPGLYRLSVANSVLNAAALANVSVFPNYRGSPPDPASLVLPPTPTGSVPSAIAIDTVLGVAIVAQAGANAVQVYTIGTGTLTALGGPVHVGLTPTSVSTPTGVAVNEATHQALVVNYGDKSLTILQLSSTAAPSVVRTIGLGGVTTASPYSTGVDSDKNLALVAFSSTNIGAIVNLNNAGTDTCIDSSQTLPCATTSVTLGTGQYPQVAVEPSAHRAWVTPGGVAPGTGGPLSVVDLLQTNRTATIASASRTSNVVTITTSAQHNLDPGNPGVVLIAGLSDPTFNGSFPVLNVVDAFHFTYSVVGANATAGGSGVVRYGKPNLAFNVSTSMQGIAINTITRTAAIADPIASGSFTPQINLINSLDQSINSISLAPSCFGSGCNGPEIGTTYVAFQPYSNVLVSSNAVRNEVSFVYPDPGDSTRLGRQFLLATGQAAAGSAGGLNLSGGLAVDPATNQAFLVNSGTSNISIVKLTANAQKSPQITQLVVPGGVLPQATLTSNSPLAVQIFGAFGTAAVQVLLDEAVIVPSVVPTSSGRRLDITMPANPYLLKPKRFALSVVAGGVRSNVADFSVLQAVDLSGSCANSSPTSVVIDDVRDIAVVTNSGCNTASVIDVNPANATTYGTAIGTVGVGSAPAGVAVVPRYGFAVVANNGAGTASILDLRTPASPKQAVPDVTVGTSPNGVAINPENGEALVANTGSNTVSAIDLSLLLGSSPATSLTASSVAVDQQPIAIAIDPDRGTSSRGLAVVTAQQISSSGSGGVLDVLDLGTSPPTKSSTAGTSFLTGSLTGIVFDPTSTLFYTTSSTGNAVTSFNPDNSRTINTPVGVNPTSLAFNPQTGALLTLNSGSNTISIVDMLSNPFRTRATLGISGSGQYGAAIHPRTNIAVIADPANKRVLLFPMP